MKIHISVEEALTDTEITIRCGQMTEQIEKIIEVLRVMDLKLTGIKNGQTYILDASKVLYIDTADRRTFLYLEKEVYETPLKLYELEDKLSSNDFFRAGKSCIVNFNQIRALRPDIDGRILITMNNGEKLFVSRQYAAAFKKKLGIKG